MPYCFFTWKFFFALTTGLDISQKFLLARLTKFENFQTRLYRNWIKILSKSTSPIHYFTSRWPSHSGIYRALNNLYCTSKAIELGGVVTYWMTQTIFMNSTKYSMYFYIENFAQVLTYINWIVPFQVCLMLTINAELLYWEVNRKL